jgi:hypothetical protein
MKKILSMLLISASYCTAQTIPTPVAQIKTALMAAPEDQRNGAMVYGYSPAGEFVVLQAGTTAMVCLTDDPKQPGVNVSCYHKDLEPFMQRGRVLKKEGRSYQEIFDIREKEVKEGKLKMPSQPTTLYVFTAEDNQYDKATGDVKNGYLRSVIYIPFATAESTGLPLKPAAPGMPWIMDAGTHRAHIMINPPNDHH